MTLTDRLRWAALERAQRGGQVVGDHVVDESGVIDLRALEDRAPATRASDPASLGDLAGQFDEAGDVTDLYESRPDAKRRGSGLGLRRGGRRSRRAEKVEVLASPTRRAEHDPRPDVIETRLVSDAEPADLRTDDTDTLDLRTDDTDTVDLRTDTESGQVNHETDPTAPQQAVQDFNRETEAAAASPVRRRSLFDRQGSDAEPAPLAYSSAEVVDPPMTAAEIADEVSTDDSVDPAEDTAATTEEIADEVSTDDDLFAAVGDAEISCPVCSGHGKLDFENEFLDMTFYSCTDCFHMWHDREDIAGS